MSRENMFRINLDDEDILIDHEELILRRESEAISRERRALDERLGVVLKKSIGIEAFAYIILYAVMMVGFALLFVSVADFLSNKRILAIPAAVGALCLVVSLVLIFVKRAKDKKDGSDKGLEAINDEYGRLGVLSEKDLRVPAGAKAVEIFTDMYGEEENEDSAHKAYVNDEVKVFEEDGNLCLYWGSVVLGIPKDSVEAIVKVNDEITFSDWTKDIPYDSGCYLQYGIVQNKVSEYEENYSMNGCYSVRFTHSGTPFELLVPLYEITPFLDILKIEPIND